ncbi:glycosyltransferase family 4 protein [Algisphaera agarilytica]|uniref:Glycosyltransferase involved in cell wall biosynthesis n=1 Tax=Algisphaera agarilytica TaxID=1385975 RepID=A0A7X0LLM6_9BACT|nr:glycosyltransferase family 4 protein [Algisphaera agarilytica]MBB6430128.1 glycosyltransferase involved in cell wall biosynthesis [Algisphaera agarilytica]
MSSNPPASRNSGRSGWGNLNNISLIGNYLPRRCGIATFTSDLADALATAAPDVGVHTVAMNDRAEGYRYPSRVWFEINQNRMGEYKVASDFLNMGGVDVVSLQHEFGIFGGKAGSNLYDLLRRLRMPVVATLHTVLKDPKPEYRDSFNELAKHCDRFVVMADRAYEFLTDIYGIEESRIRLIHHGIPDVPFVDPAFYKDQFGVEGKKVIFTFGLLGPSKGLENMVEAMPAIVAKHPDAVYVVLGATHPGVLAHSGEEYRLGLQRRAKELGVADNILWFNKFVELEELVEFLGSADVYVTPYENEAQITSGTLAYALGTGKATVATPYWYAQEMLADGRGRLVPFKDTKAMSDAIIDLFDNEVDRHAMRKRAYQFTRDMRWSTIAGQYLDLFEEVREERNQKPKPVSSKSAKLRQTPELQEIKLDHLHMMTDDCGILSHAKNTVPDRAAGYTVSNNARALVAVLVAQDHMNSPAKEAKKLDEAACRYLAFLEHAFDEDHGRFRVRMNFDRTWEQRSFSEDAHGQAIRALGETVARSQVRGHLTLAASLFHRALPACESFEHVHGWAYSLIGIHAYLRKFSGDSSARRVREALAHKLFDAFKQNGSDDWPWPTDTITYTASRLPHALLLSGRWMFNNEMIQQALRSLEWLHDVQYTGKDEQFAPVGSLGWYPRGGEKARFNQTPAEASGTIDANLEAYRVTNDRKWLDSAYKCLNWFLGDNDLRTPLYDNTTGGCCNALLAQGVDENQGAQATVSWLLSLLSLYEHNLDLDNEQASALSPTSTETGEGKPADPTTPGKKSDAAEATRTPPKPTITKNLAPPAPNNPSTSSA